MPAFVDTNVFVYRYDSTEPEKQRLADAWLRRLWESGEGRTSIQVLQELYVTLTRKLSPGMEVHEARTVVDSLNAWRPVVTDVQGIRRAWQLQDRYALSWWDALIVAAAQTSGCDRLITEDLADGQSIDGVAVTNPFRDAPE